MEVGRLSGETLGDLLRGHRTRAGLTQAALAEKSGLSEQAISMLERGTRRRPRQDTIQALTAALGLDPESAEQFLASAHAGRRRPRAASSPEQRGKQGLTTPFQLPPAVSDFTGRDAQLEVILATLTSAADQQRGAVGLVVLTGMGGIGKTALAVHAAHKLAEFYPDGQLYLNLRGYGPGEPMTISDSQGQLLRSLGLESQSIPGGIEEASALLRSQLAGRKVLMLLDNATDLRQVMPLLPGSSGSAAIITSRGSLTTLPGSKQIRLDGLSETESVELLSGVVGPERLESEPDAAEDLTRSAGRLPLAIRLVGARLAARPNWPLRHVVDQLQDEHRRLDGFGSDESGVRASIASSVRFLESSKRDLDRRAASALALLSVPDGADLLTVVAAQLLNVPTLEADAILERLVDLNLLESIAPERYRFHDLIRAYARELAEQRISEDERGRAIDRVLRFYIGFAWGCHALTHGASPRLELATIRIDPVPELAGTITALSWLDDERQNIIDRFHQAASSPGGESALFPELALALFGYNESRSRWAEMRELGRGAVRLAEQLHLPTMAAWLEHDSAIPEVENGDLEAARFHLAESLRMFRALSDRAGQARCCSSLSHVLERLGRIAEALEFSNQALALSQQLGDKTVEGVSYVAIGALRNRLGDFPRADQAFAQSIKLAEESGDARSLAKRHLNAGISHLISGRFEFAVNSLSASIEVAHGHADGNAESEAHEALAKALATNGDFAVAEEHAMSGLRLARKYGNRVREGRLLIELAKVTAASGDPTRAIGQLTEVLDIPNGVSANNERVATKLLDQLRQDPSYTYQPNLA